MNSELIRCGGLILQRAPDEPAARANTLREMLPSLTPNECETVLQFLEPVSIQADACCAQFRLLSPRLILPLTIVNSIQYPMAPVDAIAANVAFGMWVTAVDNVFDDTNTSSQEVRRTLEQIYEAVGGYISPHAAPIAQILATLMPRLRDSPVWNSWQPWWVAAFAEWAEGSMYEHWAGRRLADRAAEPPPPMAEYLYFAQRSIGLKLLWATGLVLEANTDVLPYIPQFMRFAALCAPVLRLANDLATYQREMLGPAVNAVFIGVHDRQAEEPRLTREDSLSRTLADLRRELSNALAHARELDIGVADLRPLMQRMFRGLELGVEIYQARDLREWDPRGQSADSTTSMPSPAELP